MLVKKIADVVPEEEFSGLIVLSAFNILFRDLNRLQGCV